MASWVRFPVEETLFFQIFFPSLAGQRDEGVDCRHDGQSKVFVDETMADWPNWLGHGTSNAEIVGPTPTLV